MRTTSQPPLPKLIPLRDDQPRMKGTSSGDTVRTIEFQYQPLNFTETGWEGEWAEAPAMGQDNPIQQYSNGKQKGYKFVMRLWAADSTQDIQPIYDVLKSSVVKDLGLARPPRWSFIWGQIVNEVVVIRSLGEPTFDAIRDDGSLRGLSIPMVLAIHAPIRVELTGQPKPHTYYYTSKYGDTWETIAQSEYGEPLYGHLLRNDNPTLPFPGREPGTIIALPPLETISERVVEPMSMPLMRTPAGLALRAMMFRMRSAPRYVMEE